MTFRNQPTSTLSKELYGSSKRPMPRRKRPKQERPPRPSGLDSKVVKNLPTISEKADRFFKASQAYDDDREPDEETDAEIQATIAAFKAEVWEHHIEELRAKGGSHADSEDVVDVSDD